MAGLLPIMWSTGTGSEVMRRIAAPMVGGMISSTCLLYTSDAADERSSGDLGGRRIIKKKIRKKKSDVLDQITATVHNAHYRAARSNITQEE